MAPRAGCRPSWALLRGRSRRGVAQLGSAPASGAGGRGFESRHPDHPPPGPNGRAVPLWPPAAARGPKAGPFESRHPDHAVHSLPHTPSVARQQPVEKNVGKSVGKPGAFLIVLEVDRRDTSDGSLR